MPRRPWLDHKVGVLLDEFAGAGMQLDHGRAESLITDQVRHVATVMRATEPTARKYLSDDAVRDLARRMLFEFVDEQPGADLLEAPRTVVLSVVLVAITVTALAEAMQVRAVNDPPDQLGEVIATYGQILSGIGQIAAQESGSSGSLEAGEVMFPPALLRRAARYIAGAAQLVADGGQLPPGVPEADRAGLVRALRRDADGLDGLV
jgi:hypothetical protein